MQKILGRREIYHSNGVKKMEINTKGKIIIGVVMLLIMIGSFLIKNYNGNEKNIVISENKKTDIEETNSVSETESIIIVDVEGAVSRAGIVEAPEKSRIYQVIEKAGGLLPTANTRYINLAEEAVDGSIIYVPFKGENDSYENTNGISEKININNADKEALMTLTGIGESYAQDIIDYRDANGSFKSIEDLKNVSGIGEKKFEKIKDSITTY